MVWSLRLWIITFRLHTASFFSQQGRLSVRHRVSFWWENISHIYLINSFKFATFLKTGVSIYLYSLPLSTYWIEMTTLKKSLHSAFPQSRPKFSQSRNLDGLYRPIPIPIIQFCLVFRDSGLGLLKDRDSGIYEGSKMRDCYCERDTEIGDFEEQDSGNTRLNEQRTRMSHVENLLKNLSSQSMKSTTRRGLVLLT